MTGHAGVIAGLKRLVTLIESGRYGESSYAVLVVRSSNGIPVMMAGDMNAMDALALLSIGHSLVT